MEQLSSIDGMELCQKGGRKVSPFLFARKKQMSRILFLHVSCNTLSLFKTPRLRLYTLGMYVLWFGHGFVYYGIGLNIGNIGGDLFLNFLIFGLVDVPSFILAGFTMAHFRRKVRDSSKEVLRRF